MPLLAQCQSLARHAQHLVFFRIGRLGSNSGCWLSNGGNKLMANASFSGQALSSSRQQLTRAGQRQLLLRFFCSAHLLSRRAQTAWIDMVRTWQ